MNKKKYFNILFGVIVTCTFFVMNNVKAYGELIEPVYSATTSSNETEDAFKIILESPFETNKNTYGERAYNMHLSYIESESYLEYGQYYLCIGNIHAANSRCYFYNDLDLVSFARYTTGFVFQFQYDPDNIIHYRGYGSSYELFSVDITDTITQGTSPPDEAYVLTNAPYFKFQISEYSTYLTIDNYMLNTGDIALYVDENGIWQFNDSNYVLESLPYDGMSYIDVPISSFYDNESGLWIPYQRYFKPTNEDNTYQLYFTYIDDSSSSLPSLPLELFINNNILDIETYVNNIANSIYSSSKSEAKQS